MANTGDLYNALLLQQTKNHAEVMERLGGMDQHLLSIDNQAKITNGRITKAETDITALKDSKNRVYGGVAVVVFMVSAVWQWFTGK